MTGYTIIIVQFFALEMNMLYRYVRDYFQLVPCTVAVCIHTSKKDPQALSMHHSQTVQIQHESPLYNVCLFIDILMHALMYQ